MKHKYYSNLEAYVKNYKNTFFQGYIMEKVIVPSVFSCSLNWVLDLFLPKIIFFITFGLRFLSKGIYFISSPKFKRFQFIRSLLWYFFILSKIYIVKIGLCFTTRENQTSIKWQIKKKISLVRVSTFTVLQFILWISCSLTLIFLQIEYHISFFE